MFPAHSLIESRIRQLVQILYTLKDDNFTAQKATDQLLAESERIERNRKVEDLSWDPPTSAPGVNNCTDPPRHFEHSKINVLPGFPYEAPSRLSLDISQT
ncbi:hypothetical protein CDAR_302801 [Caerostris darwini]|uniref:Uncharacterized protein n=1 Tax=Caerostris darwini TaxID=1538125 RepID=A0AAV4V3N5_9ARAC|nr:hypothetical protein CDAR_302801 [Caerostris darwini]